MTNRATPARARHRLRRAFPARRRTRPRRLVRDLRAEAPAGLRPSRDRRRRSCRSPGRARRQALAALRRELEPDAILMFGLAGSARAHPGRDARGQRRQPAARGCAGPHGAAKAALAGSGPPALRSPRRRPPRRSRRSAPAGEGAAVAAMPAPIFATRPCGPRLRQAAATHARPVHPRPAGLDARPQARRARRKRPTLAALTRAAAAALLALRLPPGLAASPQPSPPTQTYFTSR